MRVVPVPMRRAARCVVKGGHIRLRHDDGYKIQIPATPSDRRGDLAARTRLMNKERKHRD